MISYDAAIGIIATAAAAAAPRTVRLEDACGATVAEEVRSHAAVPSFDNAAMDGFAMRSAETSGATAASPVEFARAGSVAAGQRPPDATPPRAAWEIMTGAPMPTGCDAVVPVERAILREDGTVLISEPLAPGQNRRAAGTDFAVGDLMLRAGDLVTPASIMALAAVGHDSLRVRLPPRVAVLTTGNELSAAGPPGAAGMIRDVNGPYLAAMLAGMAVPPVARGSVSDEPDLLAQELDRLSHGCELILTTGGVSAGRFDFVPATIERMGGRILFHKVAIRPGKPLLLASLPQGTLLVGLPGNPMAVAVGMRFFVLPAIRAMMGRRPETYVPARVLEPVRKRPSLTFFAKALASVTAEGIVTVRILPGQESYRISPLLRANCWAIVPEGREDVAAGDIINVAPLLPEAN